MGKKSFAYHPARIVAGSSRWYLVWYAPSLEKDWERYRETFNLNRIHNLRIRKKRAEDLRDKINWWLDQALPAWEFSEQKVNALLKAEDEPEMGLAATPLKEALIYIRDLKMSTARHGTRKSYKSVSKLFLAFFERKGWAELPIYQITRAHGAAYMDSVVIERQVSNTTYNNNLRYLRVMWSALKERGYVEENIFKEITYRKKSPKIRRNFTQEEGRIVMARIRQESELLFYGLLLEYCCYLRPVEILRLRRRNIDLEEGFVEVPGREAKSYEERFPAIPDSFIPFFRKSFFAPIPADYYVFGYGFKPHPNKPCGNGTMYRKHKKVLEELQAEGQLTNITGLQYYSWKDTGITDALDHLPIIAVQDQAGHATPQMTLKYRHKKRRNERFQREFPNELIE